MICLTGDAGAGTLGLVTITGEVRLPGSYALFNQAGRLNIRLRPAPTERTSGDNVILLPGDSIDIPEYVPSVWVTGAVNAAGSVLWRRGAGLGYYISAAGGHARNADDRRTNVRYANGEVRTKRRALIFFSSSPTPDPGAEEYVPGKEPSPPRDWAATVGILASLASVLASTVAIIVTVR